jgi:hypothetical protein
MAAATAAATAAGTAAAMAAATAAAFLSYYRAARDRRGRERSSRGEENKRRRLAFWCSWRKGCAANQRSLEDAPSNMPPRLFRLKGAANQRHSIMPPGGILEPRHMDRNSLSLLSI